MGRSGGRQPRVLAGRSAAARRHYEAQVALATGAQDEAAVADGYFNMGHVLFIEHADEAQQRDYVDQAVAAFAISATSAEWPERCGRSR